METLSRSSSMVFSDNYRGRDKDKGFSSPIQVVGRPEIRFLSSPIHVKVGFSHSISLQHNRIHPVFVSSLSSSSETQKHLQDEETQIPDNSKTVHVKFELQKECAFGEQFHIIGDDPMFGSWDPLSAIPMDWSDGHVWTVGLDIPIGKSIQFKFILKGSTGNILWQPGPDRILQTWETKNTISVCEDWDNAKLQMLIEEEPTSNEKAESTSNSETLIIAENLSQPRGGLTADADGESASTDTITNNPTGKPLPERSMSIVAENITEPVNEPQVQTRSIAYSNEEHVRDSNKDMATAENNLGNSGRVTTLKSFAGTKDEASLVSYEVDPVLVPGLTPSTTADNEETSPSEDNKNGVANAPLGIDKQAKEHNVPEIFRMYFNQPIQLDLKKTPDNDSSHPKDSTEMMFNDEEELHGNEQAEPISKQFGNFMENDVQWGRKTLQKLLTSFGFF